MLLTLALSFVLTVDGSELTEPNQIANALNNYFATVAPNLLQHEHQTKESYNNEPQEAESLSTLESYQLMKSSKCLKQ